MSKIFLCYRSEDDLAAALLDEKLCLTFGVDAVFRASRSIRPGESYEEAISHALKESTVMLVLVGPEWGAYFATQDGVPEMEDFVFREILTALENGATIIPLLHGNAPKIDRKVLPARISNLAGFQYMRLDHRHIARDIDKLLGSVANLIKSDEASLTGTPIVVPNALNPAKTLRRGRYVMTVEASTAGIVDFDVLGRDTSGEVAARLSGRSVVTELSQIADFINYALNAR